MCDNTFFAVVKNRARGEVGFQYTKAIFNFVTLIADIQDGCNTVIQIRGNCIKTIIFFFFCNQFLIQEKLIGGFFTGFSL